MYLKEISRKNFSFSFWRFRRKEEKGREAEKQMNQERLEERRVVSLYFPITFSMKRIIK